MRNSEGRPIGTAPTSSLRRLQVSSDGARRTERLEEIHTALDHLEGLVDATVIRGLGGEPDRPDVLDPAYADALLDQLDEVRCAILEAPPVGLLARAA